MRYDDEYGRGAAAGIIDSPPLRPRQARSRIDHAGPHDCEPPSAEHDEIERTASKLRLVVLRWLRTGDGTLIGVMAKPASPTRLLILAAGGLPVEIDRIHLRDLVAGRISLWGLGAADPDYFARVG